MSAYANAASSTPHSSNLNSTPNQPAQNQQPNQNQPNNQNNGNSADLGSAIDDMLGSIASGNHEAFVESVRRFDLKFGLDKDRFAEGVRQFNEGLAMSQAGLTGLYQGQPTMAANQQRYAQQLGVIQTASQLQANPFRQAEAIGQLGGLLSGGGVAGFQAPGMQAAGSGTGLGAMQQLIDDIRGGPSGQNAQAANQVLAAIPTPNKLDSVSFARATPNTQNLVLQGMQQKYGLNPDDALSQIKATLPGFTAPTTFAGTSRG